MTTAPPAPGHAPALNAERVRRIHRARRRGGTDRIALDSATLRIETGQWLALLGPNGSGKSTLLRLFATLEAPDEGDVAVLGRSLSAQANLREARKRLGVVFQAPGLDLLLTVRENLACQAALFGLSRAAAAERIDAVAVELGVHDRLHDRAGKLSGGLLRRADLARALLNDPDILLLDEPTTGLDLDARSAFLSAIEARHRDRGATIVMATHLMDEAERAGRIAMMSEGRIVADGAPEALRRELGGSVVRCDHSHRAALEACGLAVSQTAEGAIGAGDEQQTTHAAAELIRLGVAFHVGPPTLGDVYLARTGRALAATPEAAA